MRSWRVALPLRCLLAWAGAASLAAAIVLATSTSSRAQRAKTSFDASLVWPSLQTMDRLRAIHSVGNNAPIANAGGFSRPLASERPVG